MPDGSPIVTDEILRLPVSDLRLDPQNPRLPEEMLGASQARLLQWLDDEEALDELAASMLANGFFAHEPLVVLRESDDTYTVVEGNRRFATISILLRTPPAEEADLQFEFERAPRQERLEELAKVPCLIVSSIEEVRKFLGFRHIGGLKTWSPEAKARYLEEEVERARGDGSEAPFRDVGRRVGSNATGVRSSYLALQVLRSARDYNGLTSLANSVLRDRFGVWTRLLNSGEVREYIGLGDPSTYEDIQAACAKLREANLGRVLRDLVPPPGATRAVLQDSRDVTKYGRVLANDEARDALTMHGDLELAHQVVDRASLAQRLDLFRRSLDLVVGAIDSYEIDEQVVARARALESVARSLAALAKDRFDAQAD